MNMISKRFWAVILGLLVLTTAARAQQASTQAQLVIPVESVKPGDTVTVGVLFKMQPSWHIYWKNSGESGIPTKINWKLPQGITAGEVQWPTPEIYYDKVVDVTTYVMHDEVMLLVPLTVGPQVKPEEVQLAAAVSWLECKESCIPGKADIEGKLKIATETKPSADAAQIKQWQDKLPKSGEALKATARWEGAVVDGSRQLVIELGSPSEAADWDFFPFRHEDVTISAKSEKPGLKDGKFVIRKKVSSEEGKWPTELKGLLAGGITASKPLVGYEATIRISGDATPTTSTAATSKTKAAEGAPGQSAGAPRSLGLMLFYAFIGGLILNIMPCVLPVISLKILGFVKQSQEDPGQVKILGLIYGLGVIVSFLVLAAIVIAVQKAGNSASWGMQFQNPQFLVILTVLVTLVALNLFGVFEVTMSSGVMGAAGQLAAKKGPSGAFFNGVLATILATPCTAPFLGTALGFAFSQPASIILLFFLVIGLGLAAPYVLLSWQPKWLKFLPKPGAWMERFKIIMGFPMLATAFWLFSIAAGHFGRSGVLWLGMMLVFVGLAAYIFGEFVQRGSKHRGIAGGLALLFFLGGSLFVLEGQLNWRTPQRDTASAAGDLPKASKDGIAWKAWSAAAVEEARKSGKPVFVDFTADWCVTCQANKKSSIEITSVKEKLAAINAVSFLGDFTYSDPAIAAELKKYGRAGVPLVLVFPADPGAEPIVLPEILTPGIVLDALDKVVPKQMTAVKPNDQ